jgi:tetratricopeptide (TPR) repeat protein
MLPLRRALAELHLETGDLNPAREIAERSVQLQPASGPERLVLGRVYLGLRQFADARKQLSAAVQLSPNDPAAHLNLGLCYAAERKLREAEAGFETALKLNPRSTEALALLASLWSAAGQQAKVLERVNQYLASFPDDPRGYALLGAAHLRARRPDLARTAFEQAVRLNPADAQNHLRLGQTCRALGDTGGAIASLEKAVAVEPKSAMMQAVLGDLYWSKGRVDLARKRYELALAADGDFTPAVNNLAWLHAEHGGNLDVALSLAQKAKELSPNSLTTSDTLGWIQYKKGLHATALPLFEECVKKLPSSPLYRYHLGMTLVAVGRNREARQHLESALKLRLGDPEARLVRDTLTKLN